MQAKETTAQVQPYLFFDGKCEQALDYYRRALGAEVVNLMRYKENPDPAHNPPGSAEKVMHATFRIGDTTLMASDGMCQSRPTFHGFSLTLNARNVAEAERLFAALGDGGKVQMPMTQTFFSPRFGMVADRFGVSWMVIVPK
jgi:PhnB protein